MPKDVITENETRIRFSADNSESEAVDFEINIGQRSFAGNMDQWLTVALANGEGWYFTKNEARRLVAWLNDRLSR